MTRKTNSRSVPVAAVVLAAFLLAPVSAFAGSQYVVVAVEPAMQDYSPGLVLNVNDSINIPSGTVVTLLGEDGSVNAIPGPADITVTEEAVETVGGDEGNSLERKRSTISKLADLLAGERKNADSLGVARGLGSRPKPRGLDDPWVVSVHGDGAGCIRGGEIRLGRSSDKESVSVSVAGDDAGNPTILTWRKGEADLQLPKSFQVEKRELVVDAGTERATIAIKPLPQSVNLQNPVDVLGWMISEGCEGQALAFTRQLVIEAQ
jgi:hypothetical protein